MGFANLHVYGAQTICPSCINMPSTKETVEWLDAALSRKFPNQSFSITYIDVYSSPSESEYRDFSERVVSGELFYPLVVLNGKVVGEGDPRLKTIVAEMVTMGYKEKELSTN